MTCVGLMLRFLPVAPLEGIDFTMHSSVSEPRLAFFENAKMTEDVVYAFSDMMRYVLKKSSNQLGPLKDELAHVNNYLKIQTRGKR